MAIDQLLSTIDGKDGKSIICWEIFGRTEKEFLALGRLEDEFSSFFGQNMLWQSPGGSFGAYHTCIVAKYLKLHARFLLQNST